MLWKTTIQTSITKMGTIILILSIHIATATRKTKTATLIISRRKKRKPILPPMQMRQGIHLMQRKQPPPIMRYRQTARTMEPASHTLPGRRLGKGMGTTAYPGRAAA